MIPEVLHNTNMFVGGNSLQGDVPSLNLPKLSVKVEEYRAGGMDAPIDMDMGPVSYTHLTLPTKA